MVRRTSICALAAVMALCFVPQTLSYAESIAEKCPILWLAERPHKNAIEREAASRRSFSNPPKPSFAEPILGTLQLLAHSFDGRAPPRISIAG